MIELLTEVARLAAALGGVASASIALAAPAIPLVAWAAFWYFAVDWTKLRPLLRSGGIVVLAVGVAAAIAVAVAVDPIETRQFGPVPVSNFVHKFGWASAMTAVAFLAGAAQLSRRSSRPGIRGIVRAD